MYEVEDLKVGTVLTYNNSGWGDCSVNSYVVTKIFVKKTNPNKGMTNKATISPIVSFDDKKVTYDSNLWFTISLIFNKFSSGLNFDNQSPGSFNVDKIQACESGIMK
jgi:hypothetical protein